MALVRIERDCTGQEASRFMSSLVYRLIKCLDLSALLDDIQAKTGLDEEDLRDILISHLVRFSQREDEEVVDWIMAYLVD